MLTEEKYVASKRRSMSLLKELSFPKNSWEVEQLVYLRIELIIEDLKSENLISKKEIGIARNLMAKKVHGHFIQNPHLKNEKIKEIKNTSLIRRRSYLNQFSKFISINN